MDGPELSRHERMILNDIEQDLCADQLLDRRLRTLRRGIRPWASPGNWARRHGAGLCTCLLGAACAALLVCAVSTSAAALIWAFAAVWALTLTVLLRLVIRWCRRTAARDAMRGRR
ncbi:DUF3040 domain-containing protein [Streptomyces sp. NPDC060028]|uniref:DUF3040 domain-containing protein n=1 Tax=Streptomyces sp. NPDC060028 TaxID=3347041 RepID=UPI0036865F34